VGLQRAGLNASRVSAHTKNRVTPMEIKKEIYPNSPLVEVVFEIRFPGEPAVECRRDEFYAAVREEYPEVFVPEIQVAGAPALQPYRFGKLDRSAGIMLAIDKFAYYTRKYPGYKEFEREFLTVLSKFHELFRLEKLKRTGWRYINIIPFTREGGNIPLKRFLNFGLHLPQGISEQYENLSITSISKIDNCSVTTKLESIISSDRSREALLLDFDCAKSKGLLFSKTETYIEESHKVARKLFESLITDSYREYLRGEEI
jgi:uncharacterized protein (TIGR04255 family)